MIDYKDGFSKAKHTIQKWMQDGATAINYLSSKYNHVVREELYFVVSVEFI